MKEENITPIIYNLLKSAHINRSIKEDLFQDLYLYHLQLEKRYNPTMSVPIEAFMVKFLKWRMWTLIKTEYVSNNLLPENISDYREEEDIDLSPLIRGIIDTSENDTALLILRHVGNKSYSELTQYTGLSIEGTRKKLNRLENQIKWEGINKEIAKNEK